MKYYDNEHQLEKEGFTSIHSVLSDADVQILKKSCRMLLEKSPLPREEFSTHRSGDIWKYDTYTDGKTSLAIDVLGQDSEFDILMEKIFTDSRVCSLLNFLHGNSYKITQVNLRKVIKGDPGLNYHQDTEGETGIGILLDDRCDSEGTTVFIPGTHRWPFTIREVLVYPRIFIPLIPKRWTKAGVGKAGDMYFFIIRVWHGRPALRASDSSSAILISVFGAGGEYHIHRASEELQNKMPETIRGLIDDRNGVRETKNGFVVVDKKDDSSGIVGSDNYPINSGGFLLQVMKQWVKATSIVTAMLKR